MHDHCWLSRSILSMETLRRDNALEMRDKLITPINNARTVRDLRDQNRLRVLQELEKELRLAGQVGQGIEQGDNFFKITRASFNITIDSTSPTQVPMKIQYQSQALELIREIVLIFDFISPREINLRRTTEAIVNDLLNITSPRARRSVTRVRRQIDGLNIIEKSTTQIEFERNCADHSGLLDFVSQLRKSLEAVRESNEEAKMRLRSFIADLRGKMGEQNRANLNLDILLGFFNVTMDEFTNIPERESSDYKDYLQQLIKVASDSIRSIDSSSFAMWQTSTELLYNELTSILSYQCNGFADCLEVAINLAENLVANLPISTQRMQLIENLKPSSAKFLTLATAVNVTLPDAIDTVAEFHLLLQAEVVSSYWCSSLPSLTEQPPPRVNISLSGDLILNCSATSSLPVSVHWRKNGVPIPSANNHTYILTNAKMSDSGNYTCVVTNAVGSTESLLTNVTVFEVPEFFFVLDPVTTMVGNDSGAWFACNASGFPYPGWRWYFRSHLSQPWTEISGEDTNELIILSPHFGNQGLYTCEAFNDHGFIRAEPVYLTVLPRTVSQLSLGVAFRLSPATSGDGNISGDCSTEDVDGIISEYLNNQIELGRASVDSLGISYYSNNTEFAVSFALVSENVTDSRIHTRRFEEIQNQALPSRGDVVRVKEVLQSVFSHDQISFACESWQLMFTENSLNFDLVTYRCPEGQELSSDFMFCGKLRSHLFSLRPY